MSMQWALELDPFSSRFFCPSIKVKCKVRLKKNFKFTYPWDGELILFNVTKAIPGDELGLILSWSWP